MRQPPRLPVLAAALGLAAPAVFAMAPPLPCEGTEGGMTTHALTVLDPDTARSGVTVERYQVDMRPDASPQGVYRPVPAPVPALDGFFGVRVVHCASGTFLAIDTDQASVTVAAVLASTEHLRPLVQAGRRVGLSDLEAAVGAVYGRPIRLRDTEETCGCSTIFPDLRPPANRPFGERTDTKH
jgi:hypothetical protein